MWITDSFSGKFHRHVRTFECAHMRRGASGVQVRQVRLFENSQFRGQHSRHPQGPIKQSGLLVGELRRLPHEASAVH